MTLIRQIYNLLVVNPSATNKELAEAAGCSEDMCKTYKGRLKRGGYISYGTEKDESGKVTILKDYRKGAADERIDFRRECYMELVSAYLDDFHRTSDREARIQLGREIRLMLDKM